MLKGRFQARLKNRQGYHGAEAERRASHHARSRSRTPDQKHPGKRLAIIDLSHSDTRDGLKRAIKGRITALARLQDLFVKSRWTGARGQVEVMWLRAAGEKLVLPWIESGGPAVKKLTRKGLGTIVVERMIRALVDGEICLDWCAEGLACQIVLQL
jgi:hypothetical protein